MARCLRDETARKQKSRADTSHPARQNLESQLLRLGRVVHLLIRFLGLILRLYRSLVSIVLCLRRGLLVGIEDLLRAFLGLVGGLLGPFLAPVVGRGRAFFGLVVTGGRTLLRRVVRLLCAGLYGIPGVLGRVLCVAPGSLHILLWARVLRQNNRAGAARHCGSQ